MDHKFRNIFLILLIKSGKKNKQAKIKIKKKDDEKHKFKIFY